MPDDNNNPKSEWKTARFWLAIGVTVTSIASVAILAGLIISVATNKEDAGTRVLSSILPLLGTWVGTVLAYYFSKENFEAATKSVTELAKQITTQDKLQSTQVSRVMISRKDMFVKAGAADTLKLSGILDELEKQKKGDRVPILGTRDEAQYILHRSLIDKFLSGQARGGKSATDVAALTVADLLKDPDLKKMAGAFGIVKSDATLSDVADLMTKIDSCQDVFVTQTGDTGEAVLGWITNVIVQDNSKV
jgi:hypothetical protein